MMKDKKWILIVGLLVLMILPLVIQVVPSFFIDITKLERLYPVFSSEQKKFTWVNKKPSHWRNLNGISINLRLAIILSEDWAFYEHAGVDTNQLTKIFSSFLDSGKIKRGGSTISQQLVKNAFLSSERTIARKLKEFILVKRLESRYSKDKILENYLNILHLGKNIYGVERGARYYFNKSAQDIRAREASFMAMLLPSPEKYSESFKNKKLTDFALKRVNSILDKMVLAKAISKEEASIYKKDVFEWERNVFSEEPDSIQL